MKTLFIRRISPGRSRAAGLLALGLLSFLWLAATARAQVSVSPAALYIDHTSRSGTLTLYNPGNLPAEVEISFAFGYPKSDEQGNVSVPVVEEAPKGEPSAVPWLRAFPRRLVLQPSQRQTVRVLAQPPAGLVDGEYWARVLVRARGGQAPIEQVRGDVRVQLEIETVIVNAITYRKGPVRTGLTVQESRAAAVQGGVELTIDLERSGNAAYLGRIRAQLIAPGGRIVSEVEEPVSVYRQIRRRLLLPVPGGRTGSGYIVRYTFDTERPDLPANGPLPLPPITGSMPVRPAS